MCHRARRSFEPTFSTPVTRSGDKLRSARTRTVRRWSSVEAIALKSDTERIPRDARAMAAFMCCRREARIWFSGGLAAPGIKVRARSC